MGYQAEIFRAGSQEELKNKVNNFIKEINTIYHIGWYKHENTFCCYVTYDLGMKNLDLGLRKEKNK